MDPEWRSDHVLYPADDPFDLVRQGAAVRIAQNEAVGTGGLRREDRFDGIIRIRLVAVEEVLGIVDDLIHVFFQERHGFLDHREVFLQCGLERLEHMEVPGLAEDRRHRGAGGHQRLHARVV
jgi:hypothetical protein